ncbi:MAG: threonine/serine dehydratase [Parvularculaceae bacterium]|nr:threonine/serine dehydratase [Parvularculaceae bacterium]
MSHRVVSAEGVRAAAARLSGVAAATPLLEFEALNARVGGRVLVKAETLQHGGSFKFRGAWNRLSSLTEAERRRGVLAWSSGNHALGVALAGKRLAIPSTIVMPSDAPRIKADQVRALGAEIIAYDRAREDREAIGRRVAAERGLALAPSYDHPDIIEGQGTVALEAVAQARAMGAAIDVFVICCGGGGLAAGCATILEEISPATAVAIAEPEGYDETWASIRAGRRLVNDVARKTLCDAIATPTPGELTFPILQRRVSLGATVSDADVGAAMAYAFRTLKLVVEPGGAAALAAVLAGKVDVKGKVVAVTLSGGNVDPGVYQGVLAGHA